MQSLRHAAIRLTLDTIAALRLDRALAATTRGLGVILTFHRVTPEAEAFAPENAGLSVTPAFLESALTLLRTLRYEVIPIGALAARLAAPDRRRPFAVLTFDDGYRDTLTHALPILRRFGTPFTLYACPGFADRSAALWWLDLEEAIGRLDRVALSLPTGPFAAPAGTLREKRAAFGALYWRLRALDEADLRVAVTVLALEAGIDPAARLDALCLDWAGLASIAAEPLATIGAHTVTHPRLARIGLEAARDEMAESRARLRAELGVPVEHLAYPVGDPASAGAREYDLAAALGFETAVTTRPGVLHARHADAITALPRVSVNGLYQDVRYLRALISGVPFALGG